MENRLLDLIADCKEYLDEETINEVMHFYRHGEYEMSLEGLIIEMIKLKKHPRNISVDVINELVVYYRLDCESVFDYNFWNEFTEWILRC